MDEVFLARLLRWHPFVARCKADATEAGGGGPNNKSLCDLGYLN